MNANTIVNAVKDLAFLSSHLGNLRKECVKCRPFIVKVELLDMFENQQPFS